MDKKKIKIEDKNYLKKLAPGLFDDIKFFEEPSFIDKQMVKIINKSETLIEDGVLNAIHSFAVDIDEKRLERWVKLCLKLEHIDEQELVNIATHKKFMELHKEIADLKKQLDIYKQAYYMACREVEILEEIRHKKILPENTREEIMKEFLKEVTE